MAAYRKPKLNIRNTFTKWFMDCILLGAIFNTVAFLVIMGILKGQSLEIIGQNIRTVSGISVPGWARCRPRLWQ